MAIMSIVKQGAASINPFFFHFTRPYLLAILVGATMAGGVVTLTLINLQCSTVVTVDTNFERVQVTGWLNLKLWAQEKAARPPSLPDKVKRTVDFCAMHFAVPTFYKTIVDGIEYVEQSETCAPSRDRSPARASSPLPTPHKAFPEPLLRMCMAAPTEIQRAMGFPEYFHWCTKAEMEAAPDHLRSLFSYKKGTLDRCNNWDDGTCITYGADKWAQTWYGQAWPGWCTDYVWDGMKLRDMVDCTTVGTLPDGDRVEYRTDANVAARRYCGIRIGSQFSWPSTRLAPAPH